MNAGADYRKARAHAQANADQTRVAWQMHLYNGTWWIERYSAASQDIEVIMPTPNYPAERE